MGCVPPCCNSFGGNKCSQAILHTMVTTATKPLTANFSHSSYVAERFQRDLNPQSSDRQSDGLTILLWSHRWSRFPKPQHLDGFLVSIPTCKGAVLAFWGSPQRHSPLGSNITFHQSLLSTKQGYFSFKLVLSR